MKWQKEITDLVKKTDNIYPKPDSFVLNELYKLIESHNYIKMYMNLGECYVEVCREFFEGVEDYTECIKIRDQVYNYNKVRGTNILNGNKFE